MTNARRPAHTTTPTQTIPSSRHRTSSSTPSSKMPLEILEQISTRYLAPIRFLVETFSKDDYVCMISRDPEEIILAQARIAAYMSMINKSSKRFILSLTFYSNDNHFLSCRTWSLLLIIIRRTKITPPQWSNNSKLFKILEKKSWRRKLSTKAVKTGLIYLRLGCIAMRRRLSDWGVRSLLLGWESSTLELRLLT